MKQNVEFIEEEDKLRIRLSDSEPQQYVLEKTISPKDKIMKIGVTKSGEVRIREVEFDKNIYNPNTVRETADILRSRFQQEGCKPCITVAEINKTVKSFAVLTPKDIIDSLFKFDE